MYDERLINLWLEGSRSQAGTRSELRATQSGVDVSSGCAEKRQLTQRTSVQRVRCWIFTRAALRDNASSPLLCRCAKSMTEEERNGRR